LYVPDNPALVIDPNGQRKKNSCKLLRPTNHHDGLFRPDLSIANVLFYSWEIMANITTSMYDAKKKGLQCPFGM
jgi:hypothetical protein